MAIPEDCYKLAVDFEKLLKDNRMTYEVIPPGKIGIICHTPTRKKLYMAISDTTHKQHIVYNILKLKEQIDQIK
jgi:hypothetical protein